MESTFVYGLSRLTTLTFILTRKTKMECWEMSWHTQQASLVWMWRQKMILI